MNTPPEPAADRRDRSFSDAAALFRPIVPGAGMPVAVRPQVVRDLPIADLPDDPARFDGPQAVPAAPRVPAIIPRAAPRPPSPPPTISQEGQLIPAEPPPVQEVPYTAADLLRAAVQPRPEAPAQAALPMPRAKQRIWPLVILPVLIGAVISLAWFQPPKWQAQFQQEVVQPPAPAPAPEPAAAEPPIQLDLTPPAPPTEAAPASPFEAAPVPPPPSPPPVAAEPTAAGPVIAEPPAAAEPLLPIPPSPVAGPAGPPTPAFQWVVIRLRAASPAAQAEGARIAALLQPLSARLESQPAQDTSRTPTIRYFRPEDATAAQNLAAALPRTGAPWRIRSATAPRGAAPGKLEVWPAIP